MNSNTSGLSPEMAVYDTFIENLITEGGETFFNYLRGLGLENERNMMVLSSRHHYCYDYKDLQGVNILINMKILNKMRHLDSFIITVSRGISPETRFIGCFSDSSSINSSGFSQRNGKRITNYSDSIKDIQFDKDDITQLLQSHGFKVCDMTEIKGLTYFMTQPEERSVA
jgi:hypothetical protein